VRRASAERLAVYLAARVDARAWIESQMYEPVYEEWPRLTAPRGGGVAAL
jgi:hypothetical protein